MDQERRVAVATVIDTWGSSPRPVGSQLIIDSECAFNGSVSGGCIEAAVISDALEVIKTGKHRRLSFGVATEQAWDVGLACGGEVDVYIESAAPFYDIYAEALSLQRSGIPSCMITNLETGEKQLVRTDQTDPLSRPLPAILMDTIKSVQDSDESRSVATDEGLFFIHVINPEPELIIIGAVHITIPLAKIAGNTGYRIKVIDPRTAFATKERFPGIDLDTQWPDEVLEKRILHYRTALVALTHDPKIDDPALMAALRSPAFYIGALGSGKTHAARLERLRNEGFTNQVLSRIHGPVGLDIGAVNPEEIAISIMAEITQKRRVNR